MQSATAVEKDRRSGAALGAAFLMAVSAIGPGFLTQTTQFTVELGASLAFAILVSVVIDIGAQLNTWRVICVSRRRGQEVANAVLPGLGWAVAAVVVLGSFTFNIGNLNGCALGLKVLLDWPQPLGAAVSALLAVGLFFLPRMLAGLDWVSKALGVGMIGMTLYVVWRTAPPVGEAALRAVWPQQVDVTAVVTLVGGTIGGYIMFSGAHRLLDGGVAGPGQVGVITWASIQGIVITGVMRLVLFLSVLGVVATGASISSETPVFDAFRQGAGKTGSDLSGLVFWCAAITSVIGCSYTSITFLPHDWGERARRWLTAGFIVLSLLTTLLFQQIGWKPTPLLIAAGTVNGVLLPVVLGVILVAAYRRSLMGDYRHPWWAGAAGVLAWLLTLFLAYWTVAGYLS
jgi:Mn2+/Fe2+ NRAMP family transporter